MDSATISNLALDLLGEDPISSIDEDQESARLCKRHLVQIAYELQREFPWKQFIKRAQLSSDTTAPEWGYTTRYLLPSGCLKLIDVYVNEYKLDRWTVESGYVLCNVADGPLQIRYIEENLDYNNWDMLYVSAVYHRLAQRICMAITSSPSKKQELDLAFREVMQKARHASALEGIAAPVNEPSGLEIARMNGLHNSDFYGWYS